MLCDIFYFYHLSLPLYDFEKSLTLTYQLNYLLISLPLYYFEKF